MKISGVSNADAGTPAALATVCGLPPKSSINSCEPISEALKTMVSVRFLERRIKDSIWRIKDSHKIFSMIALLNMRSW